MQRKPLRPLSFDPAELSKISPAVLKTTRDLGRELDIDAESCDRLIEAYVPLCRAIDARRRAVIGPLVVGVNGAQGSGKTTFSRFAEELLRRLHAWRVCSFSIDDFYLGKSERLELAQRIHPLLATRGVPGTHEVALGLSVLSRLRTADGATRILIPAFDKSVDDRAPRNQWREFAGRPDVVIFEGWCVGAEPQAETDLEPPINSLEATEDVDGVWRRYVNQRLQTDYAQWFSELDLLIFLQVPGFEQVREWRGLQERKLAEQYPDASDLMAEAELDRFLMFYERTTRHGSSILPERADLICRLDGEHRIVGLESRMVSG